LKKNINQKNGIILFSILIILCSSLMLRGGQRKYDIQIFATNIHNNISFNKIKRYGVDRVIFRTFQNQNSGKGLLFGNSLYKIIELFLDNLILKNKVSKNLGQVPDIYAWFITRNFNWTKKIGLFDYKFYNGELKLVKKYDLFNERAVNEIIAVYKELAAKEIDGILIQDDFIIRFNEGMSELGTREFEKVTGVPANIQKMVKKGNFYNTEWVKIKKRKIIEVLGRIIKAVKGINSKIKIGMNVYYETPVFIEKAEQWYSHNLRELTNCDLDYIYLMAYQMQIKNEMNLSDDENKKLFKQIVEEAFNIAGDKLIVKLQVYNWKNSNRVLKKDMIDYLKLIPKEVKRICFTPVKLKDLKFIKNIIKYDKEFNDE